MANKYNLRSQDHDENAYAALPGTAQSDYVAHHTTAMKSKLENGPETFGSHPSRWIYELLNNDFTACPLFERARRAHLSYSWEHEHRLVVNGNQSFTTSSGRFLSSVCLECNFHFLFKISWDERHADCLCSPSQSSWPLRDDQFPWHHLAWVCSELDYNITRDYSKYYPILARENFVCAAPPCTFQLTLEISEPRMASWWVDLLRDSDTILQQLKRARKETPDRYEGATDDWATQAPSNLNTYLKNLLESGPNDARSISKRNKRFAVLFGPRCFSIFRQLEFKESVEEVDGVDEGSFTPIAPMPAGGPSGSTELGTYRAYLEDVRAEVQNLIHNAGQAPERPTFITGALHAHLDCREVPDVGPSDLVKAERYRLLGLLPMQSREMVVNAYKRQWELLPSRRKDLIDVLMSIANDSGDEELSNYAITQSSVFDSQLQRYSSSDASFGVTSQALAVLGLSPPNSHSAETIIEAFRKKIIRDPSSAHDARGMLMAIAEASSDDAYQTKLLMEVDTKLSLETAKVVLGLDSTDGPWQDIVKATKAKLEETASKDSQGLYLDALDSIAEHLTSGELKQSVMELRHANSLVNLSSDSSAEDSKMVDLELPVGLHNIGNTCYLNSLLQYLFTVKPIRDIVFHYDDLRLDLTDECIQSRRLGGNKMQMDRGEAVVAQAFAQELAILFKNLRASDKAATRPSQRLANAVLLSTHTLLTGPKRASPEQAAESRPPPLPVRPSPAPPVHGCKEVDMVNVSVHKVSDPLEIASNPSTRTLVDDNDDARSDRSYEKVNSAMETAGPVLVVPEPSDDDVKMNDVGESMIIEPDTTEACMDLTDTEQETIDQKVLNALEHQSRSSGTDQQDVEEVMGSIINRLQAAIRPSSVDLETGIQLEKIMETFFVTTVNYTKKFDEKEYQHEISFDRSITAFPAAEGPCSLYDALGRNFDQQILEDSKLSRYTALKTLPPVLHILIQRSQTMNSKNGNPVVIPETLYLDRYLDAPHDSPIFRRRVEAWMTGERIADIKSLLARVEADPTYFSFLETYHDDAGQKSKDGPVGGNGASAKAGADASAEESWDFDGPIEDDFMLVTPEKVDEVAEVAEMEPLPPPPPKLGGLRETYTSIREAMEKELEQRQQALEECLSSQKQVAYRLHAVICHRGHLTSGHYWVWIHDFEANLWRWYNDADVKENKDTAEVLRLLSTSGEPYFLCYVRDEDKEEYVGVPGRQLPNGDGDVKVEDAGIVNGDGDVKVEDAGVVNGDGDVKVEDAGVVNGEATKKEEEEEEEEEKQGIDLQKADQE